MARDKDRALRELAEGRYEQARELLEEYLGREPEDDRMRLRLADVYRRLELEDEAVNSYIQAARGFATRALLVQAISCMKQVLELRPDDDGVHDELADLYARRGMVYRRPEEEDMFGASGGAGAATRTHEPAPGGLGGTHRTSSLDLDAPVFWGGGPPPAPEPPQVRQIPLLADLEPDELKELLPRLGRSEWPAGAVVFAEGDAGDSLFLISRGRVGVYMRASLGEDVCLAEMGEGEFFGEFALLGRHLRQATIKALEDTELLEISRGTFDDLVADHPDVLGVIRRYYEERIRASLQKRCLLLRSLPAAEREKVLALGERQVFPPGTPILREGMRGARMYVIAAGEVDVMVDYGPERIRLARLGLGEFFGEISALTDAPCTADVVAVSQVEAVAFTSVAAQAIVEHYPTVKLILDQVKERRTRSTMDALHAAMTREGGDEDR